MNKSIQDVFQMNTGTQIPAFGLGTYLSSPKEVTDSVLYALEAGYRHIDTAKFYENEKEIGDAIKKSNVPREDIFITTKLWMADFPKTKEAFENSLKALQCDYLDLYLIHWPGTDVDMRHKAWDTMNEMKEKGLLRACGVSNFMVDQMQDLIDYAGVIPANNQLEIHPWCARKEEQEYCKKHGITVTSWGPIFHGHLGEEPLMAELGEKYGKSAAQVTLRWHLQHDLIIIPKSIKKARIIENAELFDFEISKEDMEKIDALDGKGSFAPDSHTFNG